ncbi:hypothetical protein J0H58_26795 [bacterium]|nr:hypothetical protein [bacterium]
MNGKPLPEVEVVFLPDSDKGNRGPRAAAYTDERGRYRLFCDQADRTGTIVGPTRVCVIDITAVAPLDALAGVRVPGPLARPESRAAKAKDKRTRVPAAYGSVAQTPLYVEVVPGRTVFDFDIPSTARQ